MSKEKEPASMGNTDWRYRSDFRGGRKLILTAAHWIYVGQTQGRGKLDRHH
jgi:hypothetical protein